MTDAEEMILRKDAKTLQDICGLLRREGYFNVLPSVLGSIADDILKYALKGDDGNGRDR